jgi:hypothetical protein
MKQDPEEYLRSQPHDAMPSIGVFMRECDITLEEAIETIAKNEDFSTRITRVPGDEELPQRSTNVRDVFDSVTPKDMASAYRYSFLSQVMPAIVMAYKLMEAAGETSIEVSAPVDMSMVDFCDWPNPYAVLDVRKVNGTIKFRLDGEWKL